MFLSLTTNSPNQLFFNLKKSIMKTHTKNECILIFKSKLSKDQIAELKSWISDKLCTEVTLTQSKKVILVQAKGADLLNKHFLKSGVNLPGGETAEILVPHIGPTPGPPLFPPNGISFIAYNSRFELLDKDGKVGIMTLFDLIKNGLNK